MPVRVPLTFFVSPPRPGSRASRQVAMPAVLSGSGRDNPRSTTSSGTLTAPEGADHIFRIRASCQLGLGHSSPRLSRSFRAYSGSWKLPSRPLAPCKGMARVRSGQAPAWLSASTRRSSTQRTRACFGEHQIRRSGHIVQGRPLLVVGWADIPGLSTCVGRRRTPWLQSWLHSRRNAADP